MRRIIWSRRSRSDLVHISGYIADFSPEAARRLSAKLVAAVESLDDYPERGRLKGKVRELTIISPYVIRYQVDGEAILIRAIRHGARRPL